MEAETREIGEFKNYLPANLEVIRKIHPAYAQWIENHPASTHIPCFLRDGTPNAVIITGDNGRVNRVFPVYPPTQIMSNIYKDSIDVAPISPTGKTLMMGFALGHTVKRMLDRVPEMHQVMVLEPEVKLAQLALGFHDFTKELESGKLLLLPPADPHLSDWMKDNAEDLVMLYELNVIQQDSERLMSRNAIQVFGSAQRHLLDYFVKRETLKNAGEQMIVNQLTNWGHYNKALRFLKAKEQCDGIPAIAVTSGPSLKASLGFLRQAQDYALIIAPAQASQLLFDEGIRVDVWCALDMNDNYDEIIDPRMYENGTPLSIRDTVSKVVVSKHGGPIFYHPDPRAIIIKEMVEHRPGIDLQYSNVGHLVYSTACQLGCSPVFLVGYDLNIATKDYDPRQVSAYTEAQGDQESCWFVPSEDNIPLPTTDTLQAALNTLVENMAELKVPTFNATRSPSAKIEGAPRISWEDALKRMPYPLEERPDWSKCLAEVAPNHLKASINRLRKISRRLGQIVRDIPGKIKDLESMRATNNTGKEREYLAWFEDAIGYLRKWMLTENMVFGILYTFFRKSDRLAAEGSSPKEKLDNHLEMLKAIRPKVKTMSAMMKELADSLEGEKNG